MSRKRDGLVLLKTRFWKKVDKQGPTLVPKLGRCWVWVKTGSRYGSIHVNGKGERAHRVAWFLETGKWPTSNVLHKCDNSLCVRVSHLYEGSHSKNMQDREKRSRGNHVFGERNPLSKLSNKEVNIIKHSSLPSSLLARLFGVHYSHVWRIRTGKIRTKG